MGRASRWFRGLFGFKASSGAHKSKKKWSSAKSGKEEDNHRLHGVVQGGGIGGTGDGNDASKRAIAVAAATAAVAEAAVAAAQAAAAVVRLTSSGRNISVAAEVAASGIVVRSRSGHWSREEQAAVTIQSHFRAYLSRRALRALKALVRLQALVRGHLVRKQTTYVLYRLQALMRAQTRARSGRVLASEPAHSGMKTSHFSCPVRNGPATPEKVEHAAQAGSMEQGLATHERSGSKSSRSVNYDPEKDYICVESRGGERYREQRPLTRTLPTEDDQSAKILEIDTGANQRRSCFSSHLSPGCHTFSMRKDPTAKPSALTASCGEAPPLGSLKFTQDGSAYCTAENSPTFYSVSPVEGSSKRGVFTPTNSDCSRSCLSSYYDHPNYMSYTESSKAKVRSASAPKLRPQFDRSSSAKKYTVHRYSDSGSTQRGSLAHATFANKAYPGSGHLDRMGMLVHGDITGFSGGHWHRY